MSKLGMFESEALASPEIDEAKASLPKSTALNPHSPLTKSGGNWQKTTKI